MVTTGRLPGYVDRRLVLDAGSGVLLAEASLGTLQAGSAQFRRPDGRPAGLSIGGR